MPKVIKDGIFFSRKFNFPEGIPSGLKTKCFFCYAELQTTNEDIPRARRSKRVHKTNGGKIFIFGWNLKCPQCEKQVFFALPKMTDELFQKANGW